MRRRKSIWTTCYPNSEARIPCRKANHTCSPKCPSNLTVSLAKLIKDLSKDVGLSDVSLLEIGSAAETIDPAPNSLLSLTTNVMGSFASLNGTAVTWPWITVICNSVPCFQAMRFSPGRRPDTSLQELHILQRRPQGLFLYGSAANCYGCVSQTGSESFALLGNWCHQIKFIPELKLVASCSAADKSHDAYFASIKITQANSAETWHLPHLWKSPKEKRLLKQKDIGKCGSVI
ncbi:EF-hand calcium-binding domain-containing protein 8 isoform 1-T1 [Alca torda]